MKKKHEWDWEMLRLRSSRTHTTSLYKLSWKYISETTISTYQPIFKRIYTIKPKCFKTSNKDIVSDFQTLLICHCRRHPKDGEGTVFTGIHVSVHREGVSHLHLIILPLVAWPSHGVPHIHPIILPLVPCPFQICIPSPSHNTSTGPRSFPLGMPQPYQDGVHPRRGWGTGHPGEDGVLPSLPQEQHWQV